MSAPGPRAVWGRSWATSDHGDPTPQPAEEAGPNAGHRERWCFRSPIRTALLVSGRSEIPEVFAASKVVPCGSLEPMACPPSGVWGPRRCAVPFSVGWSPLASAGTVMVAVLRWITLWSCRHGALGPFRRFRTGR